MKRIGKFTAFLGALLLVCMTLFVSACDLGLGADDAGAVFSVSVKVNDPALGSYTLSGADSEGYFRSGDLVTLILSPKEGYAASLTVNGEEVALSGNIYKFQISADTEIGVVYSYRYRILTTVTEGKGKIEVSAPENGEKYFKGEIVSATVTPEEGYALDGVTLNGEEVDLQGAGTFWFSIEDTIFLVARFVKVHAFTVQNEDEKGTVTVNGRECGGPMTFPDGTEVTVEVVPTAGNRVQAVYLNDGLLPLSDGKATVKILSDTVIEVVYVEYFSVTIGERAHCTLTLNRQPEENGKYAAGTELFLTVETEEGYTLLAVLLNGERAERVNGGYAFTVTEDVEIDILTELDGETVYYEVKLSQSDPAQGTVSLNGTGEGDEYAFGTELTLTVRPAEGYDLDYITVNFDIVRPKEGDGVYTYTFTVRGYADIFVSFRPLPRHAVTLERRGLVEKGVTVTLEHGIYGLLHDEADYADGYFYTGEKVRIGVAFGEAYDGAELLFYSLDGAPRKRWTGEELEFIMDEEDVSINFFLAPPTWPIVLFDLGMEGDPSEYYRYELRGDVYVFTILKDPMRPKARFEGWSVQINGEPVPAETTFTVPYSDDRGATVSIAAHWVETVTFAIDSGRGKVEIDGEEPPAFPIVYDKGSVLALRITPEENYVVRELRDGKGELLAAFTGNGPVECTLTLREDVSARVVYRKTSAVTLVGGEGKVQLLHRDGSAAAEERFESGTELFLAAAEGFTFREIPTAEGTELLPTSEEDKFLFTVGEEDVTISFSVLPKLKGVNFPADRASSTGAPKQGIWTGADALTIGQYSIVIGEDPVTEADSTGAGGATKYTLKTESGRTYTLGWFAETQDYVLELIETASALRAAGAKRYYVDGELAESVRAVFSEPLGGEWKSGESVLTLGDEGGFLTLTLDRKGAEYILSVPASACCLVVMEGMETAYVMTAGEKEVTLGGLTYSQSGGTVDPEPQDGLPNWDGTGETMREVTLSDGGTVTVTGTVTGILSPISEQSGLVATVKGGAALNGFLFRRDNFAYFTDSGWSDYQDFDWYDCPLSCEWYVTTGDVYDPAYFIAMGSSCTMSVSLQERTLTVSYSIAGADGGEIFAFTATVHLNFSSALTVGFAQNGVLFSDVDVSSA